MAHHIAETSLIHQDDDDSMAFTVVVEPPYHPDENLGAVLAGEQNQWLISEVGTEDNGTRLEVRSIGYTGRLVAEVGILTTRMEYFLDHDGSADAADRLQLLPTVDSEAREVHRRNRGDQRYFSNPIPFGRGAAQLSTLALDSLRIK